MIGIVVVLLGVVSAQQKHSDPFDMSFQIKIDDFNFVQDMVVRATPEMENCTGMLNGNIKFQTIQGDPTITMKDPWDATKDISVVPTVTYVLTDLAEPDNVYSTTTSFTIPQGKYGIDIVYSYEVRHFTGDDATKLKTEGSTTPQPEGDEGEAVYHTFTYQHKTGGKYIEVYVGSKISYILFNPQVEGNPHCSGNYALVKCNAKVPNGDDVISVSIEGTQHHDGKYGHDFKNVATGEYRCHMKTKYCSAYSDMFSVHDKANCTAIETWFDYQIYGEGKTYFYIGLAIAVVGLALIIIQLICTFKLCCSDAGSVEKLALNMAGEYRARHEKEMSSSSSSD